MPPAPEPAPRAAWSAGEVVVIQDVWRDQLWTARSAIVVDDGPELLVLWAPRGAGRKVPATPPTRPSPPNRGERLARSLELADWLLEDNPWDVSNLWLLRADDWHAIWVSFLETGEQWGWYVNFQEPFRRTRRGIQTMDLALDIIVEPDRSSWRWKDEDEFALFRARALIDDTVARQVLDDAEAVIDRITRDAEPFDGPWPAWRPDPSWPIPELPDGWDLV